MLRLILIMTVSFSGDGYAMTSKILLSINTARLRISSFSFLEGDYQPLLTHPGIYSR